MRLHRIPLRGRRLEAFVSTSSRASFAAAAAMLAACGLGLFAPSRDAGGAAPPAGSGAIARDEARELQSPIPYGEASIREGRKHYLRLCQSCHGKDGRALESFDFEATDLTDPERYRHGSTDGDIFFSTKEGAGMDMPPFKEKLTDEQVWQVVWFVRSLGPESARPETDAAVDGAAATDPAEARATDAVTDPAPTAQPGAKSEPDEERSEPEAE